MKCDFEKNKKYFGQQLPVWPIVAAFAMLAAGLFMVIILGNTRGGGGWKLNVPLGLALILAGAVIFVVRAQIKIKDSEIDTVIEEADAEFQKAFTAAFTETNAAKLRFEQTYGSRREKEDKFEPVCFGTFCFDRPDLLHKKGDDGKVRSSVYSLSAFAMRIHEIDLGEREISLISSENPIPDKFTARKYVELQSAELVKTEKSGYSGKTKYRHMRITDNAGETVIEFPILADAAADEYVAEINQRIKRHKETAGII